MDTHDQLMNVELPDARTGLGDTWKARSVLLPQRDQQALRDAALAYVMACAERGGGLVTREELEAFTFEGQRVKLIDRGRGIRNPSQLSSTLSILSSPDGPYADEQGSDGFYRYKIRHGEWGSGDNRKLHQAYAEGVALIWLQKHRDRFFIPIAPVYLIDEEPDLRQYTLAIDGLRALASTTASTIEQRMYVSVEARRRLHQPVFRARVLDAYTFRCAICALHRSPLLDAAHITPDSDAEGLPLTSNGLALCKIHHSAYDADLIGIDPSLTIHVAADVLAETDGPMLRYGLQGFDGQCLRVIPKTRRDMPDPDRLATRFQRFLAVA